MSANNQTPEQAAFMHMHLIRSAITIMLLKFKSLSLRKHLLMIFHNSGYLADSQLETIMRQLKLQGE